MGAMGIKLNGEMVRSISIKKFSIYHININVYHNYLLNCTENPNQMTNKKNPCNYKIILIKKYMYVISF